MVNTLKITISLRPFESWFADLLTGQLAGEGFDTFVETENGFEAYIPENKFDDSCLQRLSERSADQFDIQFHKETIPPQNWNEVWEKNYFRPLLIWDRVVVRASFHTDVPAYLIEIVIEPRMAFGTGNHETTLLMMETMLDLPEHSLRVLDVGCGTGILAILAAKLGAREVTAIDIDPWSIDATTENILLNKTPQVKPLLGDASRIGEEKYQLIMANIQKNVILNDLYHYVAALLPGGILITSGFFLDDLPSVEREANHFGLKLTNYREKNHWVAALFMLPD